MPRGHCVEWEWRPQHSLKHMSRSQRVDAGLVVKVLGLNTSTTSNHLTIVVGTSPTQIFPYHHPCLFGWGPMQYGRIPTRTYGRNWQGPRSFEAQWVWLGLASHGWLEYWTFSMPKEHFSKLAYSLCCHKVCRTCWICCKCSDQVLL